MVYFYSIYYLVIELYTNYIKRYIIIKLTISVSKGESDNLKRNRKYCIIYANTYVKVLDYGPRHFANFIYGAPPLKYPKVGGGIRYS